MALDAGDLSQAETYHVKAIQLRWELKDRVYMPYSLEELAEIALARGQFERAAKLLGSACVWRKRVGHALPPPLSERHRRRMDSLARKLGTETLKACLVSGREMTDEEAYFYALSD